MLVLRRLTFEVRRDRRQDARPGLVKMYAYHQPGPGGLPLALRLSEGLGHRPHGRTIEGIQTDGYEHWHEHDDTDDGGHNNCFGAMRRPKLLSLGHAMLQRSKDGKTNQEDLPELSLKEWDGL